MSTSHAQLFTTAEKEPRVANAEHRGDSGRQQDGNDRDGRNGRDRDDEYAYFDDDESSSIA